MGRRQGMENIPVDYELVVQETYEAVLRDGDIALDVGAHLGRHTIPTPNEVGTTGRVFAFEPLPMCRDELVRDLRGPHAGLAPRVTVYPYALADYAGETLFVVARDALAYSGLRE